MIILFSSISREQYLQDVLNVLALPAGALYSFRYDSMWVADEFRDQTANNKRVGATALIVLVVQPKGKSYAQLLPEEVELYPIRSALIHNMVWHGQMLRVEFRADRHIDWTGIPDTPHRTAFFARAIPFDFQTTRKYLIRSDIADREITLASAEEATKAWQKTVSELGRVAELRNTVFFRVGIVQKYYESRWQRTLSVFRKTKAPSRSQTASIELEEVLPQTMGFELASNSTNYLELGFFRPDEPTSLIRSSSVIPSVSGNGLNLTPKPIPINFRYETYQVPLIVSSLVRDIYTEFRIYLADKPNSAPLSEPPLRAPDVSLMLKLSSNRSRFILGFVFLFVGQLMIASAGKAAPWLEAWQPDSLLAPVAQLADGAFVLLGPGFIALALYLLYQQMPGPSTG